MFFLLLLGEALEISHLRVTVILETLILNNKRILIHIKFASKEYLRVKYCFKDIKVYFKVTNFFESPRLA